MVMLVMLMVMATAALMVMFVMLVMVTAAALLVLIMMLMVVTAAALVVMFVMLVMVTAAALVVMSMMVVGIIGCTFLYRPGLPIPGINLHAAFHSPGDSDQFRDQGIRVFCCQPQLFGGKGDDRLLYCLMIVEFLFDLRSAVGTVQIFYDIYFPGHRYPSYLFQHMSNHSSVISIQPMISVVNRKIPRNRLVPGGRYHWNRGLILWRKIRRKKKTVAAPLASSAMG